MTDRLPLTALNESQRAKALERFQIIRPFLEEGVPLTQIAQQHSLLLRTLQSWVQRYRHDGLVGLARKGRTDRGKRRVRSELEKLIEGLALRKPRPTMSYIHRQVTSVAKTNGWKAPSYGFVKLVVSQLEPALVTLAHEGTKAYQDEYDLLFRREGACPNDIWQADHTPLAIWLLDENGQPAKPWLTVIIDDYSRAIAGYSIGFQSPSALLTALALRQAIWRKSDPKWHIYGIPGIFYTDHGSDFTSKHMEQVCVDLKIQAIFSEIGQPRGRGRIERFMRTVDQLFLCEQPGYAPPDSASVKADLSLAEFEARFKNFLLDNYHQRVHGETGVAPQERWEAGGFLPRVADSLEQLDLLLLTVAKARRVHQDGIHFQSLRYMDTILAAYVGEEVLLRYDPHDMAEIRVYYRDSFICHAVCQEIAGQTIALKDIIRARTKRRQQLRDKLKDRQAIVDTLMELGRPEHLPPPEPKSSEPDKPATKPLKRYRNE